jgi:hypothetical protein
MFPHIQPLGFYQIQEAMVQACQSISLLSTAMRKLDEVEPKA